MAPGDRGGGLAGNCVSDLGWRADGIRRALEAGGVELEVYRRPGFTGGKAVRRSTEGGTGAGLFIEEPGEDDPDLEDFCRR